MLTAQLVVNTVISASLFGAIAASFALIHRVTKVLHLAHGAVVMVGAYGYLSAVAHGFPPWAALGAAVFGAMVIGVLSAFLVYEPLRRRHALSSIGNLIAAFALLLVLEAALLLAFGPRTRSAPALAPATVVTMGSASFAIAQAVLVPLALGAVAILAAILRWTRLGRAMRALADHDEAAAIVGIDPSRVRLAAFAIASAVAGIAGALLAGELAFEPHLSSTLAVKAFSRSIIGGAGSVPGALAGSFLVDFAENLWAAFGPIAFREAASLILVVVVLLFRPWGLFGRTPQ